ncbi:fibronectin type III domain-containing protein [Bacteroidota bacterium]|nr:fibronectin type III domain-containing protein [Bacteroidota bacterium]MDC3114831.1 fibronectin type III domain-containing protein [Bacteroidota bacterium]MDC3230185.1 fibronectin type III domain-containing protein [Bacteroidota bacterium]
MLRLLILFVFAVCIESQSQCLSTDSTYSTNVNYTNAKVNWEKVDSAIFYRVRYKDVNASTWSFQNNIDSSEINKLLIGLTPQTQYVWQIKSYCDSLSNTSSLWSTTDSFFTENITLAYPTSIYANNITFYNAQVNWTGANNTDRFKIRYRIFGTTTWNYLSNIAGFVSSTQLPQLNQLTLYEWSIMSYYDTTNLLGSLWSPIDTFTTAQFIPAPFFPVINTSISSNLCGEKVDLFVSISQSANQPDIEQSVVTTNEGQFDIGGLSIGDTVGYADVYLSNLSATATLKVGIVFGQNYAFINAVDSLGGLIGFFSIENETNGVKITSTSPPDGNNYTSGLTTDITFNEIFINPNFYTNLIITTNIESELQDQIMIKDTIQINCPSSTFEIINDKKTIGCFNLLGKNVKRKKYSFRFLNNQKKIIIYE